MTKTTTRAIKAWQVVKHAAPMAALELSEVELPKPVGNELRIAVEAAALGLPDALMCQGQYEFKPELPFTPGQEICGVVVEAGEHAKYPVGSRVMGVTSFFLGRGGFAEHCMSNDSMVYPVPDNLPAAEAAAFGIAYQTAWFGLVDRGQLQQGETLLVLGAAGGCGTAAIQLGRALGARVIAVVGNAEKAEACLALGADHAVNYSECPDGAFASSVMALCDGADVVFDPVGGQAFAQSAFCIANNARLLSVGFASGQWGELNMRELAFQNAAALGVYVGVYTDAQRAEANEELVKLFEAGKIKPLIDSVIGFEELPSALQRVADASVSGKIVLQNKPS